MAAVETETETEEVDGEACSDLSRRLIQEAGSIEEAIDIICCDGADDGVVDDSHWGTVASRKAFGSDNSILAVGSGAAGGALDAHPRDDRPKYYGYGPYRKTVA